MLQKTVRSDQSNVSRYDQIAMAPTIKVKRAIGHSSGRISAAVLPLSRMPRTMRSAWVVGKTSPAHCAQTGMPRNGNIKPDNKIDGSNVNWANCRACIWLVVIVEK